MAGWPSASEHAAQNTTLPICAHDKAAPNRLAWRALKPGREGSTMAKLLQIDFPFAGPFGPHMAVALRELAESIASEPGFIWKIWTENATTQQAGGIYLFEDEQSAEDYLSKHRARLAGFGIEGIRALIFDINVPLTRIDHGPLA